MKTSSSLRPLAGRLALAAASAAAILATTAPARAQRPAFDEVFACGNVAAVVGTYASGPNRVAEDAAGNRYVCGNFNGTSLFGTALFTAPADAATGAPWSDAFVAKFDPRGRCLWATQIGGDKGDDATALAVDSAGAVYVAGAYYSYGITVGAGGPTLYNSSAADDIFVARLDGATGQCRWARRAGGVGLDRAATLVLDGRGHLFVGGLAMSAPADFGAIRIGWTWAEGGRGTSFLARLDAGTGAWQWAQRLGGLGLDYMALEPGSGDLLVGGNIDRDSCRFGNTVLAVYPPPTYYHRKESDLFVGRVSEAGVWRWAAQGNAATQQNFAGIAGIAYDGLGHLYLAGGYSGYNARIGPATLPNTSVLRLAGGGHFTHGSDSFMARLDALTGQWQWVTSEGGPGSEFNLALVANAQGLLLVSGGQRSVNLQQYTSVFARVNPTTGTRIWTDPLYVNRMALGLGGKLYTWGFWSPPAYAFDAQVLVPTNPPNSTGYVARLGATVLAARLVTAPAATGLQAWPNPTKSGSVQVAGAAPGQTLSLVDVLGRTVARATMPIQGALTWVLPHGLPKGVYVLRAGKRATRLSVE